MAPLGALSCHLSWPNALTTIRLGAGPLFFCALVNARAAQAQPAVVGVDFGSASTIAAGLFWLAVATDFADGRLARARGEATVFGGLLDHASDASFVCFGLVALAMQDIVPLLLPVLVGSAFLQYVVDSRSLSGQRLRASSLGRWNGILYFFPPGIVATRDALGLADPPDAWIGAIGWLLVISTLASMLDRAWNRLTTRSTNAIDPANANQP